MGYDWHLVKVNGNVATFWMTTPYAKTYFNQPSAASDTVLYYNSSNIWANGYSKTVWKSDYYTGVQPNGEVVISESAIRTYLNNAAKTIIDNESYANYKNKVLAGAFAGNNQDNTTATKVVKYLKFAGTSMDNVTRDDSEQNQLTAYYGLDTSDRLWLPSVGDLREWGIIIKVNNNGKEENVIADNKINLVKWTATTISNAAWLRNADGEDSEYALVVTNNGTLSSRWIKNEAGVRPAIHLNITDISTEYQEHLSDVTNNSNNIVNWWNESWLQILFFAVCSLGILGVILVVIAVVARNRKANGDK